MKKIVKRLIAIVCIVAMLCGIIPAMNLKQVQATENTEPTVQWEELTTGLVEKEKGPNDTTIDGKKYYFGGYYDDCDKQTSPKFSNPLTEDRDASTDSVFIKWVPDEVMNVEAQVRQNYEGYKRVITSCDTDDEKSNLNSSTNGNQCVEPENIKEGEASLTRSTKNAALMNLYLDEARNVTGYKYFGCKIKIQGNLAEADSNGNCLYIRITSSGTKNDEYALQFLLTQAELETYVIEDGSGWYDLKLPFNKAEKIVSGNDTEVPYDGREIQFIQFRQVNTTTENVTLWVDDICALNDDPGFVIADCDQQGKDISGTNSFTYVNYKGTNEIATGIGEYKEGTGAVKNSYNNENQMQIPIRMSNANKLDLRAYSDTGLLHFWLYISDLDMISDNGKFTINLSSSGTMSSQCYNWTVTKNDLTKGWNEIIKPLFAPTSEKKGEDGKSIQWNEVDYFRLTTSNAQAVEGETPYIILDDVRVIDTVQITDCDSQEVINTSKGSGHTLSIMESVKQGSNAFVQTSSTKATVHQLYFKEAVDFSDFKGKNGSLHFWFYIEDIDLWNPDEGKGLLVRLCDSSNNKQDYRIVKSELKEGWNELYINLDKPAIDNSSFNWTGIQYLLLSCEQKGETVIKTMIDDISLVIGDKNTADVRFVSTVESTSYQQVGFYIKPFHGAIDLNANWEEDSLTPAGALKTEATNVYTLLYALGGDVTRNAEQISGLSCISYMHAATIINIPNRLWDAIFVVTPYWVTLDGTTVTGPSSKFNINQMVSVPNQEQVETNFRVLMTSDVHYATAIENDVKKKKNIGMVLI